jgi:multiple sugar transport system ATP-binding protein
VTLGVRPESLDIVGEGEGFPVIVNVVEELGSDAFAYATVERGADDPGAEADMGNRIVVKVDSRHPPEKLERIWLRERQGETFAFSTATGNGLVG